MISYGPPPTCFNTLVHMKYGLGVYAQRHCHKKDGAPSILAPLSLFSFIFHNRPWYTTPIVANWPQSHIITNLIVGILVGMMSHVFCGRHNGGYDQIKRLI